MMECDNSTRKIYISSNFILSISLLIMFDTLLLRPSLHCNTSPHFTQLHFTTLRYTSPHFTQLHFTTLRYTSPHFTQTHFTTLRYTSPHFTTLNPTTLHYTSLHFTTLHPTTLHYTYHESLGGLSAIKYFRHQDIKFISLMMTTEMVPETQICSPFNHLAVR